MGFNRASTHRAARIGLSAALLSIAPLLSSALAHSPVEAAAPADLLPDLIMRKPTDIQTETASGGVRRLRFSTTIVNIGKGPFETRASRLSISDKTMHVSQRIFNTAGGTRVHETTEVAKFAGDGHDHWHVQNVARYELFSQTATGPALRRDSKVGFCFFDTNAYNLSLPGAPATRKYLQSGCGTPSSLYIKNGISVGWSDRYPWNFAFQWIDVTGLAAGDYYLKVTADPNGAFEELKERNNCNWMRIRIALTGSTVRVMASGSGCVLPAFIPVGRVIVPPRLPNDSPIVDEASVRQPAITLLCQIPA